MVDSVSADRLRSAIELFFFGYRAFTSRPDRILAQRGLSRVHHRILYFVGRSPGLTVNELLRTLQVSKQALNAPLRKMIEAGLVTTTPGVHDRRVKQLALTAAGRKLEEKLTATQIEHLSKGFAASGNESVQGWHRVMEQLRTAA